MATIVFTVWFVFLVYMLYRSGLLSLTYRRSFRKQLIEELASLVARGEITALSACDLYRRSLRGPNAYLFGPYSLKRPRNGVRPENHIDIFFEAETQYRKRRSQQWNSRSIRLER